MFDNLLNTDYKITGKYESNVSEEEGLQNNKKYHIDVDNAATDLY